MVSQKLVSSSPVDDKGWELEGVPESPADERSSLCF